MCWQQWLSPEEQKEAPASTSASDLRAQEKGNEFPLPALRHSARVLLACASASPSVAESERSQPLAPQLQAAGELTFADCDRPERMRDLQAIVDLTHRTVGRLQAIANASATNNANAPIPFPLLRVSSARAPELSSLCFSLAQYRAARPALSVPATGILIICVLCYLYSVYCVCVR